MDFKLIFLFAIFLMVNSETANPNYSNARLSKPSRTMVNSNRGAVRQKNTQSFTITVPDSMKTYKPRSPSSYVQTSSSSVPMENYQSQSYQSPNYQALNYQTTNYQTPSYQTSNYQSPNYQTQIYHSQNYQPQKYQTQNYNPQHYQTQAYQTQNYQSQNYQPQNYQPQNYQQETYQTQNSYTYGKPATEINYVTEPSFVQSDKINSVKNEMVYSNKPQQLEIVNSAYVKVNNVTPKTVELNHNDYVEPSYNSATHTTRSISHFNPITQKPLPKIVYSPASEVSHVSFSSGNGKVQYSW